MTRDAQGGAHVVAHWGRRLRGPLESELVFLSSAPDDYTALNNTFQLSDEVVLQCVPVMITLDDVDEPAEECFTYSIASPSSVPGLTLNPTEATICVTDREGKLTQFNAA